MKKTISILISVFLLLSILSVSSLAANDVDVSSLKDDELILLFSKVKAEMVSRKIPLGDRLTLRDGKYIVGEDIMPGSYKITCTETDGETYGNIYSSFGSLYGGLGDDAELSAMMGTLGGMMGSVLPTTVEIIGDYGTILKSFELKAGESITLTLSEKTALQVSDGVCSIEPN